MRVGTRDDSIERDELGHEAVWQSLYGVLPRPADLGPLKRRAALFFARLGRTRTPAEHFAKVSQLDSAVGIIMWHLEHSDAARDPLIEAAAQRIKRDEARHVAISRRYAAALGMPRAEAARLGEQIRGELVALLQPAALDLEGLGIDPDALFRRIAVERPAGAIATGRVYAIS